MSEKLLLFVEIVPGEVRFLLRRKWVGRKPADLHYQVISFGQEVNDEYKPDSDVLREILTDYRKSIGNKIVPVYLLVPFYNGLIREFRLPWTGKKDRDAAVKYHIQYEVPVLADKLVYDYLVTEEKPGDYLIIQVTAARRDVISAYAEIMEQTGYQVRGIEYSIWAKGEIFSAEENETAIWLQKQKAGIIEVDIYRGTVPEAVLFIPVTQIDSARYGIYTGFQDLQAPAEYLISDNSSEADEATRSLTESGLLSKYFTVPVNDSILKDKSFETYALLGEMKRVLEKRNINFLGFILRPLRIKMLTRIAAAFLGLSLICVFVFWYTNFSEEKRIQQEIFVLQGDIQILKDDYDLKIINKWAETRKVSMADLEHVHNITGLIDQNITVSRLNFTERTLCLWAECRNTEDVTKLVADLKADGWKEPFFVDYRLRKDNLVFCLRVQR